MFISITDLDIDILNNPYFVIKPYVLDDNVTYKARAPKDGEIKLVKCPLSEMKRYFKSNIEHYRNTVCLEDPGKLEIRSNWW